MRVRHGVTVTVERRTVDRFGDGVWQAIGSVHPVAVDWQSTVDTLDGGEIVSTTVRAFVPRGADIRPADRLALPGGGMWHVKGAPMWDQRHPLTGTDFGFKVLQLEEVKSA